MKKTQVIENIENINKELSTSDNSKYTTVNGVKEFDSKYGYIDNIVIEGETLVNLISSQLPKTVGTSSINGSFIYDTLKNNKITIKNFSNKTVLVQFSNLDDSYSHVVSVGANKETVYTVEPNKKLRDYAGLLADGWENTDASKKELNESIVVIDGERILVGCSYFEGLKSVGQGDNISLLSYKTNENLFPSQIKYTSGKYLSWFSGTEVVLQSISYTDYIDIEPSTYYNIININNNLCFYDKDKNFIKHPLQSAYLINTPTNARYVRVSVYNQNKGKEVLVKNNSDLKYVKSTLRGLPNGVKDEIVKIGNSYKKIEKCGEVIIDGDANVSKLIDSVSSDTIYASRVMIRGVPRVTSNMISTFKIEPNIITSPTYEYMVVNIASDDRLIIDVGILKSKLSSPDINGVANYLSTNHIHIVGAIETPNVIDLPNFNPQTYDNKTTLLLNTGVIQAEAQFEVTNTLRDEINVLESKVSSLDDSVQKSFQYGIDTKKKLVDKVNSIGGDVSAEDSFDKIIEGINGGKKWASGLEDVNISCENGTFLDYTYRFKVDNLSFKPSVIHIYYSWQKNEVTRHSSGCFYLYDFKDGNNSYGVSQFYHSATGRMTPFNLSDSNNKIFYVEYGGFCLPIYGLYSYSSDTIKTVKWVAYE